jgi:hypothetical protein
MFDGRGREVNDVAEEGHTNFRDLNNSSWVQYEGEFKMD